MDWFIGEMLLAEVHWCPGDVEEVRCAMYWKELKQIEHASDG